MFDRLSANIPLVNYKTLDIRQPALVRVFVDSEIAKQMLTLNVKNRRQRKPAVDYLKRQIESGDWRDDHPQPVIFSDRGRLIDGQHRLQAISEMKIEPPNGLIIRVETGVRDDVREYLDTGVPRSLDDRVELVEDVYYNKIISQLCTYHYSARTNKSKKPTPEEAREFFSLHTESSLFIAQNFKKDKGVGKIPVAFAAMEYYEINQEKASIFYPALFVRDSDIHQARVLRDWLLTSSKTAAASKCDYGFRNDAYYRSISCMKAHLENRKITIVRRSNW